MIYLFHGSAWRTKTRPKPCWEALCKLNAGQVRSKRAPFGNGQDTAVAQERPICHGNSARPNACSTLRHQKCVSAFLWHWSVGTTVLHTHLGRAVLNEGVPAPAASVLVGNPSGTCLAFGCDGLCRSGSGTARDRAALTLECIAVLNLFNTLTSHFVPHSRSCPGTTTDTERGKTGAQYFQHKRKICITKDASVRNNLKATDFLSSPQIILFLFYFTHSQINSCISEVPGKSIFP